MQTDALAAAATTAVDVCLGVEADERCVVVTDPPRRAIGDALAAAARERTDDTTLIEMPVGTQHGAEPPAAVAQAMADADVFVAPTTKSLSHTRARSAATDAGGRGATLPGITPEVFIAGMQADYTAVAETTHSLAAAVADASTVTVETPAGTDLRVDVRGRSWQTDTGAVTTPGAFSNLPAGEIFIAPTSAAGTVVIDGTMRPRGLLEETPVRFDVDDGQVAAISDPAVAAQVEEAAAAVGDAASNFAELGIGTNLGVTELVGSVLLDEKMAGTVHVAIGDNAGIGGDVEAPLHLDGIMRSPTVTVDGQPLALP